VGIFYFLVSHAAHYIKAKLRRHEQPWQAKKVARLVVHQSSIISSVPEFRFFHPIQVRYGDLDPQGHVNNARYLTYMEQARAGYIRHLGLWDGKSFLDIGIILADARVTFLAPIHFEQDVHVGVRVTKLGKKSLTVEYSLVDARSGQEFASGSTVLVAYNYHLGRSIPIPDHWREVISTFEGLAG
jgi:acyl-CoA thioester hydrolase